MAIKNKVATRSTDPSLPTTEDLHVVSALAAASGTSGKAPTSAFVDLLATEATQKRLRELAPVLKHHKGCDVEAALVRVNEGKKLVSVVDRLGNATSRASQRLVEINKWLRSFETNLAKAQKNAATDSPVALGLGMLVNRRKKALGEAKRAKTINRKKRAKKKSAPPTP